MPFDNLPEIRKYIHSKPELSGKEKETASYIAGLLKTLNPDKMITGLGGHGIAVTFEGQNNGPHIAFRCELDALPIQETGNIKHRSEHSGASHVCGHDGHMAIMLGFAKTLASSRPASGKITLIFQPAEETGAGAAAVLADKKFDQLQPDNMFALHNVPGMELHSIGCKTGIFTPGVISLKVSFSGRTAHAGEPEKGINPAFVMADLVQHIGDLMKTRAEGKEEDFTITIVEQKLGNHNYGTSAGEGYIGLTMRSHSENRLESLKKEIADYIRSIASKVHLTVHFEWFESFRAVNNHKESTKIIEKAARTCGYKYVDLDKPFNWGEDYGLYTASIQGAMFALGAGHTSPALHHPDYDFPDEIIDTGISMFKTIAEKSLE